MILIEKIGDEIHEHFTDNQALFPNAIPYDQSSLPDNEFRNAWDLVNGVVIIDLPKAKEIKKESLRQERKPLLELQDVAFQRALESNSDTSAIVAIVAEKQRLRDITMLVDTATSIEDLKAINISND